VYGTCPLALNDDDWTNFQIHAWNNGTQYVISDCGNNTSDFSNCTVEDSSQAVWDHPFGNAASEQWNDGGCNTRIFGWQGDQEHIGSLNGNEAELQGSLSATPNTWSARYWVVTDNGQCSVQYTPYHWYLKEPNPTRAVVDYDTRNAG